MPTVIDSLVVTLGLDASKFNAEQKKAVDSLKKFEDSATKHAKGATKGIDDMVGSFKELQGRLLAIGALIAAGLGFNRLIQDVTKANTELGYLSKTLGIAAQDLSAWEQVGRTVGASAEEMKSGLASLNAEIQEFHATGSSKLGAFMGQVGIKPLQPNDTPDAVAMRLSQWYASQPNKAFAAHLLQTRGGLSQGMINLLGLGPQEIQKRLDAAKKLAPTDDQIAKFQKLTEAFGNLLNVIDKITRDALTPFIDKLTKILTLITDWLERWSSGASPDKSVLGVGPGPTENYPGSGVIPGAVGRGWNWLKGKFGGGSEGGAANDNAGSPPVVGTLAEQRAKFATELENNPALREKILRIAANEQGSNPRGTTAILESMMNRAIVRGTNLETQARWYGSERGGYYERGNMGRGALENPVHRAVLEQSLKNALSGTNASNYATDNSSGALAARERLSGAFRATGKPINGESFFAPGSSEPGLARKWDQWRGAMQVSPQPAVIPGGTGAQRTFELWQSLGGAKGAPFRGGDSNTNTNNSNSTTNIHSMNVTVPPGADPSAYADGISRRLSDYNNVQNSNTGMV